jgi:hypothetical protein
MKNNAILFSFIAVLLLNVSACSWLEPEWDATEETFHLDYYKEECGLGLCYRYRKDINDDFELLDNAISGFSSYEWGNHYTLKVKEQREGDGRKRTLSLINIEDVTAIAPGLSSAFSLTLSTIKGAITSPNNIYQLYGEKAFSCALSLCQKIDNAIVNDEKVQLSFMLPAINGDDLVLNDIECQSSENNFLSACEGITESKYYIAPFKTECFATDAALCYQFKKNIDDEWSTLDVELTGAFVFVWGKLTRIDVKETFNNVKIRTSFEWQSTLDSDVANDILSHRMLIRSEGIGALSANGDFASYEGEASGFKLICESASDCSALNTFTDENGVDERVALLNTEFKATGTPTDIIVKSGEILCNELKSEFSVKCKDEIDDNDKGFEGKLP